MNDLHAAAPNLGSLMSALILELAASLPEAPQESPEIDIARADLIAVARLYEHSTKEEVALRLYLAMRPLLATLQRNATTAGAHSRESEMPVVRAIHG